MEKGCLLSVKMTLDHETCFEHRIGHLCVFQCEEESDPKDVRVTGHITLEHNLPDIALEGTVKFLPLGSRKR